MPLEENKDEDHDRKFNLSNVSKTSLDKSSTNSPGGDEVEGLESPIKVTEEVEIGV